MKKFACCAIAALALYINVCYAEDYVAEVLVVMDQKALELHINEILGDYSYESKRAQAVTEAQAEIQYIFNETNKMLSTLAPFGVNIQVAIRDVIILSTNLFPVTALRNGNIIDDLDTLKLFSSYLTEQEAYPRYNYDAAVLLTGFDMFGSSDIYTTGVANIGRICDKKNGLSVIEYNGTYSTTIINAHNFGLLFGTTNGGIASDHIMAFENSPIDKNRWSFDQCNAFDIKEFLPKLNPNCLLETSSSSKKPESSYATYSGRLLDHNAICERVVNNTNSYTCLSINLYNNSTPKGDIICQRLYCKRPGTIFCSIAYPSDGLICDNSKRCVRGKCVTDTSTASANVDSENVLGDQKKLEFPKIPFFGTCPEYIAKEGKSSCYSKNFKDFCGATCKKYKSDFLDCEYGDRNPHCQVLDKSIACSTDNKAICCSTCRGYVAKRSTREDSRGYRLKDDSHKDANVFDGFKARSKDFSKLRAA